MLKRHTLKSHTLKSHTLKTHTLKSHTLTVAWNTWLDYLYPPSPETRSNAPPPASDRDLEDLEDDSFASRPPGDGEGSEAPSSAPASNWDPEDDSFGYLEAERAKSALGSL